MKPGKRRKKKPLPFRERLFRVWRDLRAAWPFFLGLAILGVPGGLAASDPLVAPFLPDGSRWLRIASTFLFSYRLLSGGLWQYALFVLLWIPWLATLLGLPWLLRKDREWERKAVLRRERDKQRRARKRAEREALSNAGECDAREKS